MTNMEHIVVNLDGRIVRNEMLENEEYLVAPLVMMTEGVHEANQGKGYYPADELDRWCPSWNHKPIVIDHPDKSSACTPAYLNANKVGIVLNTRWDGKQRAEAWFHKKRTEEREPRIIEAFNNKQMMEVSTGLFLDQETKSGKFKDEDYDWIARNHRPDHLAILPDKIGACSIKKGAGLLQLNSDELSSLKKEIATDVVSILNAGEANMKKNELIDKLIANEQTKFKEEDRKTLETLNEEMLQKLTPEDMKKPAVAFQTQEEFDKAITAKILERVENEKKDKAKKEAEDKQQLPPKAKTLQEFLNEAPPELRPVLSQGINALAQEQGRLIGVITANAQNRFTKEQLGAMDIDLLRNMATLAAPVGQAQADQQFAMPSYFGVAPHLMQNQGADAEVLEIPVYNADKFSRTGVAGK